MGQEHRPQGGIVAIGFRGVRQDIEIRQGAEGGPYLCTLTNQDGLPFDLTGCHFNTSVRKSSSSLLTPWALAAMESAVVDAKAGRFQLWITSHNTGLMECGETEQDPKSRWVWQVDLVEADGRISPVAYGALIIFRNLCV